MEGTIKSTLMCCRTFSASVEILRDCDEDFYLSAADILFLASSNKDYVLVIT